MLQSFSDLQCYRKYDNINKICILYDVDSILWIEKDVQIDNEKNESRRI